MPTAPVLTSASIETRLSSGPRRNADRLSRSRRLADCITATIAARRSRVADDIVIESYPRGRCRGSGHHWHDRYHVAKPTSGHLQRRVEVHHARISLREIEAAALQIDFSVRTGLAC